MTLQINFYWQDIATELVRKFPIGLGHIELDRIIFLSDSEKVTKKYAEIKTVGYPYSFLTEYKFIIVFYDTSIVGMTIEQKNLLVYHQLLHIDDNFEKLRKHDVEDFKIIVSKYGPDWDMNPNLKNIMNEKE